MDWLEKMNNAMDYIEANLAGEISYNTAASMACCSAYHFQRMFSFITSVPLSEYIRRRRLTLAAFELQTSNAKVIDMALKYGYDSPQAFSRAFKVLHGVMPVSARYKGTTLKAYPRMTFTISIKGEAEIKYRLEQKNAFEVFGVSKQLTWDAEQEFLNNRSKVPEFFSKCIEDGTTSHINELLGVPSETWIHAALYDRTDTTVNYMICGFVPKFARIPKYFKRLKVPPQTWVIFTEPKPQGNLYLLWKRIYSEWFPTSDYEQAEHPVFEMYYGHGWGNSSHGYVEVWIPVNKKANDVV